MENKILGLHHVTAIAGKAQRNFDFYTKVLGLRFVKKTVNFDDPHTYHLYYGDYPASPGTIMTFFPWEHITKGRRGTGQATEVGFSVPKGSLEFWQQRMEAHNVVYNKIAEKFGERYLTIIDPDGLKLELTEAKDGDPRAGYAPDEVGQANGIKGFHQVTLTLHNLKGTADILTDVFGYQLVDQHVNRYRYATSAIDSAATIDLVEAKGEPQGVVAGGSVHHIAFRVKDDATELKFRELIANRGLNITPQIDRNYFHSLYFREPGGVLFEIATDNPGFTLDEPVESLGQSLKLPAMYERRRAEIEAVLPNLK
jgi:glyoxalase family protein